MLQFSFHLKASVHAILGDVFFEIVCPPRKPSLSSLCQIQEIDMVSMLRLQRDSRRQQYAS